MRSFSTDSQNLKIKTDMPLVRALTARAEEPSLPSWRWCKTGSTQCTAVCVTVWRTIWREDAPGLPGLYKPSASGVNVSTNQVSSIFFNYLSVHKGEFDATGHCGECPWRGQRQNVTRVQVCVENQKVAIFSTPDYLTQMSSETELLHHRTMHLCFDEISSSRLLRL